MLIGTLKMADNGRISGVTAVDSASELSDRPFYVGGKQHSCACKTRCSKTLQGFAAMCTPYVAWFKIFVPYTV